MNSRPISPVPVAVAPTKKPFDRRNKDKLAEEKSKQDNINKNLKDNEKRASFAPKKDVNKVQKVVAAGQQLVTKFFEGFKPEKHGNVQVELDDNLPERISEVVEPATQHYMDEKDFDYQDRDDYGSRIYQSYVGITSIALAIKLQKSLPGDDKLINYKLSGIENLKPRLPPKVHQLINCVGKTDVGDNAIRVYEQSLTVKKFALKGIWYYYRDRLPELMDGSVDEMEKFIFNNFNLLFDTSLNGLRAVKRKAKEYFQQMIDKDQSFTIPNMSPKTTIVCRLPSFPFPDEITDMTEEMVGKYLSRNTLFTWHWDDSSTVDCMVALLVMCMPLKALKDRTKSVQEIYKTVTWPKVLGELTIAEMLDRVGFWSSSWFIKDSFMSELIGDIVHDWNTGRSKIFDKFINLQEFSYTEFGSPAQVIELDHSSKPKQAFIKAKNTFGVKRCSIIKEPEAKSKFKINPSDAVLGLTLGFSDRVDVVDGFKLSYKSQPKNILREFLTSDFKK